MFGCMAHLCATPVTKWQAAGPGAAGERAAAPGTRYGTGAAGERAAAPGTRYGTGAAGERAAAPGTRYGCLSSPDGCLKV